jgi:hypothetical protein
MKRSNLYKRGSFRAHKAMHYTASKVISENPKQVVDIIFIRRLLQFLTDSCILWYFKGVNPHHLSNYKDKSVMESQYLNRTVTVKLITGEMLPKGIMFWGNSSMSEDILWFGIPKSDEVHKTEVEFHVPRSSIVYIQLEGDYL